MPVNTVKKEGHICQDIATIAGEIQDHIGKVTIFPAQVCAFEVMLFSFATYSEGETPYCLIKLLEK